MARTTIKGFNGVCFGAIITVTAADESAGELEFSFANGTEELPYPLAFTFIVYAGATGIHKALADAVITVNDTVNGDCKIENGAATFALAEDDVIMVTAQYAREE